VKAALYRSLVMHNRLSPKQHKFHYNIFLFSLDLDALDEDLKNMRLVSRNKFNLFSFYDRDHWQEKTLNAQASAREHIDAYLAQHKLERPARILLLTHLRMFGYVFNPVSFLICFDANDKPYCAIAEVSNTFREMKMYLLGPETFDGTSFHKRVIKHFYVSPFIEHDAEFDFQIQVPAEKMNIRIDDYKNEERFFISTLTGNKQALTDRKLLLYVLRFPLITLQIMFLIHWNAMKLWWKKFRYFKKSEHPELQRDMVQK
jgi:uncharacterized protein